MDFLPGAGWLISSDSSYLLKDVEHCAEWKGSVLELEVEGCGRSSEQYMVAITSISMKYLPLSL
jgi:hypothetical protein